MKTDLRLTDTNAASDSKGRTWGLEGNLFWYLVGGVGAGITMFFVQIVVMKAALLSSFAVALVPVILFSDDIRRISLIASSRLIVVSWNALSSSTV